MKSWLAQGSSGRQVTLLPGTTFLYINGALLYARKKLLSFMYSSCCVFEKILANGTTYAMLSKKAPPIRTIENSYFWAFIVYLLNCLSFG